MTEIERGMRWHFWPAIAVIATLIVAGSGHAGANRWMDAHFDSKRMPVAAVDYLQKYEVKGPVLTPDYWGGYLIYRLYPATQVVVDDRHDLYGAEFFKSYLKWIHGEPGWKDFVRQHPSVCVLVPKESALTLQLIDSGEWTAAYVDESVVAFVPNTRDH